MILILPSSHPEVDARQPHCSASLAAAIRSALAFAEDIDATDISVTVLGSYVVLEGHVEEPCDLDRVICIAEAIAGKSFVKNRMLVRWAGHSPGDGWHRHL